LDLIQRHEIATDRAHRLPLRRHRRTLVASEGPLVVQRELVVRARAGDREAFAALAASTISRLFHTAELMVRDRDLADDAVQETLVLAWRDLRALRDPDAFDWWINRVLVRCIYRELDRSRRRSVAATEVRPAASVPDESEHIEQRDTIDRGFRRLRPEQRVVLVLHHYVGLSDAEAAAVLAVPIGTFKARLSRATSALRAELAADDRMQPTTAIEAVR
jgi:RNA polymerase sigma-70 factor (ECF subfamily)